MNPKLTDDAVADLPLHHARADLLVAQRDAQRLHEGHGRADLALAGVLHQAVEDLELGGLEGLRALAAALRQVAAERGAALRFLPTTLDASSSMLDEQFVQHLIS